MELSYIEEGELDAYLFHEGRYYESYEFLGAHKTDKGVRFVVWVPKAKEVYLIGDFNNWNNHSHPLIRIKSSGCRKERTTKGKQSKLGFAFF